MKRTIMKIAILTTVLLTFSCRPPEWHYVRSMIAAYYEPEGGIMLTESPDKILSFTFQDIRDICDFRSTGERKTEYDRLCEKHNDMSYDRKIKEVYPGELPRHMNTDFAAVEITSDADWDASHPAGSSLGDITMFHSVSPKKYIDSGYKDKFDWKKEAYYSPIGEYFGEYQSGSIAQGKNGYHPFSKLVSDLEPEDMILLGSGNCQRIALLEFTIRPTANKTHNISVTLTTDEGEVFLDTINMIFE